MDPGRQWLGGIPGEGLDGSALQLGNRRFFSLIGATGTGLKEKRNVRKGVGSMECC
jgi:hypothetical protein